MRILPRFLLAVTLLAGTALGSESFAANLLANPGFETGGGSYTGWFTFGSGVQISTAATDNIFRSGAAASKIYGGFVGCPGGTFNVGGYGQAFTPTVGKVYQFSGYSYIASADPMLGTTPCTKNRVVAKLAFFNAASGGTEIASNEYIIADGNSPTNQWNAFTVSAPAPSGALRVEALILYLQPACDPGSAFVDDLSFDELTPAAQPNVLANPSFTSGLASWNAFNNVFTDSRSGAVRTPTGSAKLFSSFVNGVDSGIYQTFPAAVNSVWELAGYALQSCIDNDALRGTDNSIIGVITFKDGAAATLSSTSTVLVDGTSPLGTWTRHVVTGVAPAGTASVSAYILFVSPSLQSGSAWVDDISLQNLGTVGVDPTAGPRGLQLSQNVPNPFSGSTRIDFALPERGFVDVGVYDVAGRRIATLVRGELAAGPHVATWDGLNSSGAPAPRGIYQYLVKTATGQQSRSMLLDR